MSKYETKDSGERASYASGMVRDTDKGKARFDLTLAEGVPYEEQMLTRFAALMARGAEKYGERNWQLANSEEELKRFKASAHRHLMQWIAGEDDEDHAAAVYYNVMAHEATRYKVEREDAEDVAAYDAAKAEDDGQRFATTDLRPYLQAVEDYAKRVNSAAGLGAPTHARHPDGSITEISTGRVVCQPSTSALFIHPDDKVSRPEPLDDFGKPFPKEA